MFCQGCGRDLGGVANFCSYCGRKAEFAPPPVMAQAPKTLYRSRSDRKIAGVCGGLARYVDMDPTLMRVLWFLAVWFGGVSLLVYFIMWIVMPEEPILALPPGTPVAGAIPSHTQVIS